MAYDAGSGKIVLIGGTQNSFAVFYSDLDVRRRHEHLDAPVRRRRGRRRRSNDL